MTESCEFDLLVDLSKLRKKYGPETFDRLAEQLSSPEFAARLSELLTAAGKGARSTAAGDPGAERKRPSPKEFRSSLVALGDADPEKGALLVRLYDGLMAKTVLPTTQDLRGFALRVGLPTLDVRSRSWAVLALLEEVRSRPLEELATLIADATSAAGSDRSLENWTRIILDKDLRTRKAE